MQQSFAYILNQRPFRDNSVIADIFTENYGRICCVARPARKRGKILKGSLEQFRYLKLQWLGKGNVQTLIAVDERGRHKIPASEIMLGLYLNELILLFTSQHYPQADLFSAYKYTLHKLGDPLVNRHILMRFEMYLLAILGYPLDNNLSPINIYMRYIFSKENGLICEKLIDGSVLQSTLKPSSPYPYINGELLLALQDTQKMQGSDWKALRIFLDAAFSLLAAPRAINTRKLLKF